MSENPEIGKRIRTGTFETNYHDQGEGSPVMLIHGSGPGVTAWANWRLVIPKLAEHFRVVAPDMVGFGYTERPEGWDYNMDSWVRHALDFMDALELPQVDLVGNSYGGALALALTARHPERVRRLILMGSVGVPFQITPELDAVWGYTPSVENMGEMMRTFAYDTSLLSEELARMRYEASIRPGVQEAYAAMFPAPRQRWVDAMVTPEEQIRAIRQHTLMVHGRDDRVIPLETSLKLHQLIERSQLHVFGQCGHWTQIEHNARFCKLATDFFLERDA
ncbi:alpha/beta fold hydrolase [Alkalilimnicola sp. S0819]|uniref:alpha/beta fold hydrolase n=1 Tax=Alkalilimnicola sp. S0819 TaxID=2613922 RepID=UPI0012627812|nr:alpha/beta hydrolase [Alkalilimnicola sp. S0819]KAB7623330.1 alpha/beta fold hydrolase [Alkalilimnicola sp. S0819]MPQ16868.1 alpha/beta fold hydrolase [Alkalilimnicola sp. S0819]